jgi:hypothetical protein
MLPARALGFGDSGAKLGGRNLPASTLSMGAEGGAALLALAAGTFETILNVILAEPTRGVPAAL